MAQYEALNFSGRTTGTGSVTSRPDGRLEVTAAFGSPFQGQVCDDGPTLRAVVDTEEAAADWMKRHGLIPAAEAERLQLSLDQREQRYM